MGILDDMGVSKLSAKVFFFKVNYSFKIPNHFYGYWPFIGYLLVFHFYFLCQHL